MKLTHALVLGYINARRAGESRWRAVFCARQYSVLVCGVRAQWLAPSARAFRRYYATNGHTPKRKR